MSEALEKNWWEACFAATHSDQDWLRLLQQEESQNFIARGLPGRADERWKYSSVGFLAQEKYRPAPRVADTESQALVAAKRMALPGSVFIVMLNGHFSKALSDLVALPTGVICCHMRTALTQYTGTVKNYLLPDAPSAFANLNTALLTDGLFLYVPPKTAISAPLHILYLNTDGNNGVNCPRHLFMLGEAAHAVVLEEHCAAAADNYFTNIVTDIQLAPQAQLKVFKIQNDSHNATHCSQTIAHVKKDASVELFQLALGGKFAREDVFVNLQEDGAHAAVNGFYYPHHDGQHIDHHIQIDHKATHGTSDMLYKGILDKKSHGVFNGKIYAHSGAEKTRSQQANHNLLLCKDAVIDTKPEFEIYADDVKCAHGATVGQVDTEALFYLRSRGVDAQTALRMLTSAFADNVMTRISEPAIMQYMSDLLQDTLGDTSRDC